jgi:Beta-lactamase
VRRYLTDPLGVSEVAFSADEALAFRTAIGHVEGSPGCAARPLRTWAVMPPSNPAAGNQLAMSARGLLAFGRMHLADGRASDGSVVLSVGSAHLMRRQQMRHPALNGPDSVHGLGWWLERGELVEHGGDGIGTMSMLRMAPRHGVAAVVLTNGGNGGGLIDDVLAPLFDELPGVRPGGKLIGPPAEDRAPDPGPFLGRFESRVTRVEIEVDGDGRLWHSSVPQNGAIELFSRAGVAPPPTERNELRASGDGRFVILKSGRPSGEVEFLDRDVRVVRDSSTTAAEPSRESTFSPVDTESDHEPQEMCGTGSKSV